VGRQEVLVFTLLVFTLIGFLGEDAAQAWVGNTDSSSSM
jgi:hypothetical protein